MATQDISAQWKAFTPTQRDAALARMSPEQKTKLATTLGYTEPTTPPKDSAISGALNETGRLVKGFGSFVNPIPQTTTEKGVDFLGPGALQIYRMGRGAISSGVDAYHQAQQQAAIPPTGDRRIDALNRLRALTTAASAVNPFASGSVTHLNELEDQGKSREARGAAIPDLLALLGGGTKGGRGAVKTLADKTVAAPTRVVMQEMGGAGKEPVAAAMRARNEAVARTEGTNAERIANAAKTNAERVAKEASDRAKLAAKKADYVQKEFAARQGERGTQAAEAQKQTLARGQTEYAKLALDNLKSTQKAAHEALNSRWDALRKKMDAPRQKGSAIETSPVNSKPIADTINKARTDYLFGSPEDLKVFNDLMGQIEQKGSPLMDAPGGPQALGRPLGWQEARTYYTNIGDRLYSGTLSGNVWKAMKSVHDALDHQLQEAANTRGLGKEYASVKNDWSQFKQDFDDLSNMSTGGGSPLARAVRFANPVDMEKLLKGQYAPDLLQRISKYRNRGAAPQIIDRYRELGRRAEAIEAPKASRHPAKVTGQVQPAKIVKPKLSELPPEVRPYEIRLRKLEEYSGRPISIWDAFPPRTIERLALKSKAVREWIASQPRKEIVR